MEYFMIINKVWDETSIISVIAFETVVSLDMGITLQYVYLIKYPQPFHIPKRSTYNVLIRV